MHPHLTQMMAQTRQEELMRSARHARVAAEARPARPRRTVRFHIGFARSFAPAAGPPKTSIGRARS